MVSVYPITLFYAIGLPILVSFVIMYFVASTLVVAIATLCLVYIVFCAAASVLALCNGIRDPRWHGAWHAFQQAKQLCACSIWFAILLFICASWQHMLMEGITNVFYWSTQRPEFGLQNTEGQVRRGLLISERRQERKEVVRLARC